MAMQFETDGQFALYAVSRIYRNDTRTFLGGVRSRQEAGVLITLDSNNYDKNDNCIYETRPI